MFKEYYETLELQRNATAEQISAAFKTLALKLHPQNHQKPSREIYNAFDSICEAYEILSTPHTKAVYDTYGVEKLKNGFRTKDNELVQCYEFKGNSEEIFTNFFGTTDFHQALVQHEDAFGRYLNERNKQKRKAPEDILIKREVSLLDIYKGTEIEVEYEKQIVEKDGISITVTKVKKWFKQTNQVKKGL